MSRVVALPNRIVLFTTRGTTANGNQDETSALIVHSGGTRHTSGSRVMIAGDTTKFAGVVTSSDTVLNLDRPLTVKDRDRVVNLGADTGSTSPNYDGYVGSEFVYQISEDVAGYVCPGNKTLTDNNGNMGVFVSAGRTFDYFVFSHEAQLDANAGMFPDQLVADDGTSGADQISGNLTVNDVLTVLGGASISGGSGLALNILNVSGASDLQGLVTLGTSLADLIKIRGTSSFKENVDMEKALNVDGATTLTSLITSGIITAGGNFTASGDAEFQGAISQTGTALVSFDTMAYGEEMRAGSTGAQLSLGKEITRTVAGNTSVNLTLGVDAPLQICSCTPGGVYTFTMNLPTPVGATDAGKRFRFLVNFADANPSFVLKDHLGATLVTINSGGAEQYIVEAFVTTASTWQRILGVKNTV